METRGDDANELSKIIYAIVIEEAKGQGGGRHHRMIIEDGHLSEEQLQSHFAESIESAKRYTGPTPTCDGLSDELDAALELVKQAVANGEDPQEAINNAWEIFYRKPEPLPRKK